MSPLMVSVVFCRVTHDADREIKCEEDRLTCAVIFKSDDTTYRDASRI